MSSRRSLRWPITLGVVLIVLVVALTVGWVIVSASAALKSEHSAVYWTLLAVGSAFFVLVLVGVSIYLALTVKAIRLNQRQSNFIDAVTHELKSPIASLKLYLQTLTRHQLTAEQQTDFKRFMLQDLDRLDGLIDHLLDAARLEHTDERETAADVALDELVAHGKDHLPALSTPGNHHRIALATHASSRQSGGSRNSFSQPHRQCRQIFRRQSAS